MFRGIKWAVKPENVRPNFFRKVRGGLERVDSNHSKIFSRPVFLRLKKIQSFFFRLDFRKDFMKIKFYLN